MLNPEVMASPNGARDWIAALKWTASPPDADDSPSSGADRIVIAGRADVGKVTLCNTLYGWNAVRANPEGAAQYGRLAVVDLPTDAGRWNEFASHFDGAQMILYVLDLAVGATEVDLAWVGSLRTLATPVIVAANKLDTVDKKAVKAQLAALRERLGVPVIPVTSTDAMSVHRVFFPALLKACPDAAETLGSEISGVRVRVAWQMTLRTAFSSALISLDSESDPDIVTLVGLHMRLMRRIGLLYGYRTSGGHGRELLLLTGLRFGFRSILRVAANYPRVRAWMVSGAFAIVSTVLIGRLAVLYYSVSLPNWMRWL